jgi:hypothetical protein
LLSRTPASTWRRLREEYELLRGRVLRDLGISETNLPGPAQARCGPAGLKATGHPLTGAGPEAAPAGGLRPVARACATIIRA